MKTLFIEGDQGKYPVIIGEGVIQTLPQYITTDHVLIVTDENVKTYHLDTLKSVVKEKNVSVFTLSHQPEQNKNLRTFEKLINFALQNNFPRSGLVLAFGGGAVGDFAGFFASTFMRGVDYIQLPTSILAHDSSVGGKVALNHYGIKNIIGSFYSPKAVIYDLSFLSTLPKEEVLSGFGELIKHDFLSDGTLIKRLESIKSIDEVSTEYLESLFVNAVRTKARYIKDDLYDELKTRKYLNLGHTLGHAIESEYGIKHGIAILYGICFDWYLSRKVEAINHYHLFKRLGFFESIPQLDPEQLLLRMVHDKKNKDSNNLHFISLEKIGKPFSIYLTHNEFRTIFNQFITEVE